LQHDNQPPALLVALAPDPKLFKKALPIYHRVNANVTAENDVKFMEEPLRRMLGIRYLKIVIVHKS